MHLANEVVSSEDMMARSKLSKNIESARRKEWFRVIEGQETGREPLPTNQRRLTKEKKNIED